jgi:hypothetical protein
MFGFMGDISFDICDFGHGERIARHRGVPWLARRCERAALQDAPEGPKLLRLFDFAARRYCVAPPAETFAKGRDFTAWLGLTPLQRSTGGKHKLGATSKMGERTLRRLLIIGSSAVVKQASKRGSHKCWLASPACW